jgi:predicted NUDIX family NTP pyrophosphohydrolase
MVATSAGLLLHRVRDGRREVLLVHPGGPFWANKDEHAWSIPKGEFDPTTEDAWATAAREFTEETGVEVPDGQPVSLGEVRQSRKIVHVWALEGSVDLDELHSNTFEMEWPPRSGRTQTFPEVDRAAWFDLDTARTKLHEAQVAIVDRLLAATAPER